MIALAAIALVTLTAAAVAMSLRNLIHSALLLVLAWAGIAAFYLWAGAQFAAFAQVLVYVGAISMVVLFAVLLTRREQTEVPEVSRAVLSRITGALIAAGAIAGVLMGAIVSTPLEVGHEAPPPLTVRHLGETLMEHHTASLLVIGAILTVALLGAVVIAAQDKKEDTP